MEATNPSFRVWNRAALIALISYVALAALLHHHYQYRLNPDGVSYLNIAERYAHGDFQGAINGYWAPLLPWLTAIAIKAGATPLNAVKIWEFTFGFLTIVGASVLLKRFEVSGRPRALALALCVIHALCFSLTLVTPDVVTVAMLVLYYGAIWDPNYAKRRWAGALCGLLGALAYFAKNYNFYFFAIHFAAMSLWYYRAAASPEERRSILRNAIVGFAVFLALSSVWIGLVWNKYGEITIGAAGTFNHRLMGPDSIGGPADNQGFIPPPDAAAVCMWDDPTLYLGRMIPWNPLASWRNARHAVVNLATHTKHALVSSSLVFSVLLLLLAWKRKLPFPPRVTWLIASVVLYGVGYLPLMVESRYFWSSKILGIVLCAALLSNLGRERIARGLRRRRWPYVVYGLVFFIGPFYMQYQPYFMTTYFELLGAFDAGKDYYDLAQHLKNDAHVSGNIASSRDMWPRSLQLSYFLGAHYFGQPVKKIAEADLEREWAKYDIDYYFVWTLPNHDDRPSEAFLSRYPEVSGGGHPLLRVYACKKPIPQPDR